MKRYLWLLAVLMALFMVSQTLGTKQPSAATPDAPWPMWRHDPAHTGVGEGTAPSILAVKWKFEANGAVTSSPSIVDGMVYVGSHDHHLYCVDAQTGSLIWKYKVDAPILSSPAIADGKVYIGPDDGNIYCLDANTGKLIWETPTEGGYVPTAFRSTTMIRSSPSVVDGRLYVGALDTRVYCLDAETGAVMWNYTTRERVFSSPAVVGGRVYIGDGDRWLYALNAQDGSPLWEFDCGYTEDNPDRSGVLSSPTVAEGMVYIFSNVVTYYALDAENGTLRWEYVPSGRTRIGTSTYSLMHWITPTYVNGKLYLRDYYYEVCIDAKTGTGPLWKVHLEYFGRSSAAYADGKIFTGSDYPSCRFFAFTAETGENLSCYTTNGSIRSSPSIAYGNVYVGSFDFNLYCFTQGTPKPPKTKTSITATSSTTEVVVDKSVTVEGAISPAPVSLPQVMAFFTRPDGTTLVVNAVAKADGTYEISYEPDLEGTWTVRAFWQGDELNEGTYSPEITFTVAGAPSPLPPPPPPPPAALIPFELSAAIIIAAIVIIVEVAYLYMLKREAAKK